MSFYVYELYDPRTFQVFYVGKDAAKYSVKYSYA
jgi:hypothetical protein